MEELDFLLIYEHKVRELENLCLMKYELDRRGYRTKIAYVNDSQNSLAMRPTIHAKVLCTMACYENHTLRWHAKEFVKFDKVIDLQWENIVYPKDEEREGAYKNYWGIGKDVVHISWGRQNVNRLIRSAHIDSKKVKLTGHVGMDFLREPLSRYYAPRKEFLSKYDIPDDKKIILFASPYYGDCLDDAYIAKMCRAFGDDWPQYYDFMCKSQTILLDWFEKYCNAHPDVVLVFRPHPGHPSLGALELEKRCSNFRVIAEESVKQWILSCDRIYTGNSSVVIEAFFARKLCQLLFPLPVTDGYELKIISDSKKLTTYEEFIASTESDADEFPTPEEDIEENYLIDWNEPNYVKFANAAEEVLKDEYYKLTRKQLREYKEYSTAAKIKHAITNCGPLYDLYLGLLDNPRIKWKAIENQRKIRENGRKKLAEDEVTYAHELTSDEEISSIISKIDNAING